MSMNRPHIAALLRTIADDVATQGEIALAACDPADSLTKDRVAWLISVTVQRWRERADEIAAGRP